MKRNTRSKKAQGVSNNAKITSFFTRYQPLPVTVLSRSGNSESSQDEDIIEASPVKSLPLVDLTNTDEATPPKKRKTPEACTEPTDRSSEKTKACTDNRQKPPKRKKKSEGSPTKSALIVEKKDSDLALMDQDQHRKPIKNKSLLNIEEDPSDFKSSSKKISEDDLTLTVKQLQLTPEKQVYNLRGRTPKTSPSPSMSGCTSGDKVRSSPRKTPGKTPKKTPRKTPKKLFDKVVNAEKFNVEVLNNFVKVTPSKGQPISVQRRQTPSRSEEKKQVSILNYASPIKSRSATAQNENEKTPVQRESPRTDMPVSERARMKLDFSAPKTTFTKKPTEEIFCAPSSSKVSSPHKVDMDLNEAFGDSWEENFEFAASHTLDLWSSQHCKVLEITKSGSKKTVTVKSTKSEETAVCTLSDFWSYVHLQEGDTVHLSAIKNKSSDWVVDNGGGLLVYQPDFLVSSTSVVGGLFCKRKSILKERYRGFDSGNKVMLVGTLVHELLQSCLRKGTQNDKEISRIVDVLLNTRNIIGQMYESSLTMDEVRAEIFTFVPRIVTFMGQYLSTGSGKFPGTPARDDWQGRIDSIRDIEENIWCPELGIKGKVDVSVGVHGSVLPLEVKTGRASMSLEHRGQIILYIMMMNKLGYKVPSGLLLYLREGVVREIPMNEVEKRDLTILRNELAYYLTAGPGPSGEIGPSGLVLPSPINHHSACGRCEYSTLCCLYLTNDGYDLSGHKHLSAVRDEAVSHLETSHVRYFVHWSALLALESGVKEGKQMQDIYTRSPEHREKNGKCISYVKVLGGVTECNGLYSTTFQRTRETEGPVNLLLSGIGEQSYVVVSKDTRPAVAAGLVSDIGHKSITMELDRNLNEKYPNAVFHLDTYDSSAVNTFNFSSLALLMEPSERAQVLRKLIIDKEKPTFRKSLPTEVEKKAKPILKKMNKMQQRAVIKALAANDYLLIKGMPGTGKTATIVALVQFLVALKQTVLIISHTHLAVDNVCIRLHERGMDVLRLGSETRIHPKLLNRSERFLTRDCTTPEDLARVYNGANIIAATCIGTKHPLLSKRTFDVCIVDESSQVLQCSVIRALNSSKKFILMGDPDQLPPVVKNREAMEKGMSESLFERLQSTVSTVTLNLNYRMNKQITALANDLAYGGQLLTANEAIANATLKLPKKQELISLYQKNRWVLEPLDDGVEKSVWILDTGPVWDKVYKASWIQKPKIERTDDNFFSHCVNPSEAAVVATLVRALIKGGMSPLSIGVIAPYRAQVAQISVLLKNSGVDVSTVDQFQGQEKEVILYSCTKSRDPSKPHCPNKFEILEDKRRLTVAITRARHKLILVADTVSIKVYEPFRKLLAFVEHENRTVLTEGDSGFSWESLIASCDTVHEY